MIKHEIINEQNNIKIDEQLKKIIDNIINNIYEILDTNKDFFVTIIITDNENIKSINKESRNIDKETDVLSFPMLDIVNGKLIDSAGDYDPEHEAILLGDIVISAQKAMSQSIEYGHSFKREFGFLIVHGMLHLIGYDHEPKEMEAEMFKKQDEILENINLVR